MAFVPVRGLSSLRDIEKLGPDGTTEAVRQAVSAALALDDATLARVVEEVCAKITAPPNGDPVADVPEQKGA